MVKHGWTVREHMVRRPGTHGQAFLDVQEDMVKYGWTVQEHMVKHGWTVQEHVVKRGQRPRTTVVVKR